MAAVSLSLGFHAFEALAALAVRSALLLALGWLATTLLKRAAPPARQALWASVLAGVLLLPLLVAVMPAWRVLPAVPWLASGVPAVVASNQPAAELSPSPGLSRLAPVSAAIGREPTGDEWDWRRAALLLWAVGATTAGLHFALGLVRLRRIRRGARSADVETIAGAERLALELGVRRPVRVLTAPGLASPATWGLARPIIVLPEAAANWSAERRQLVLAHEIAHVARHDFAWRLVAQLGCVAYWFNPLVWVAARRLRMEQELVCDLAVVARGARPSTYAHHLLSIARAASGRPLPLVALDMARRSQMEGRLMSILENRPAPSPRRALLLPALCVLVALPVLAAAGVQRTPESAPPDPPDAAPVAPVPAVAPVPVPSAAPVVAPTKAPPPASPAPVSGPSPVIAALAPVAPAARLAQTAPALAPAAPAAPAAPRSPREMEVDPELRRIEEEIAERAEEIHELMAPLHEEIASVMEEQMEPILERMELVELEMRPVQEEMSRVGEEMSELLERELETGVEAEELGRKAELLALEAEERARLSEALLNADGVERERLEQALRESEASFEPLREEMEALRMEMVERHRASAGELRARMEPQREQMEALRERMRPELERMEQLRVELEPIREQLEATREAQTVELRQRLEALRQELEVLHRERETMRAGGEPR